MNNKLVPVSIVIAGLLIAGAVFWGNDSDTPTQNTDEEATEEIRGVKDNDHIIGSPNADIVIVEYSDIECPFCKQFHTTMQRIMNEYGKDGKVAWVYRHFPLSQLHPNAPSLAEASECVAELGGNTSFWDFLDSVFEQAPGNTRFDMSLLNETASNVGVSAGFQECLDSDRYVATVEDDFAEAIASGGRGTPHNIVLISGGDSMVISGAQPYQSVKTMIDTILTERYGE